MTDIQTINSRTDYIVSQFNYYADTRYRKSVESLRTAIRPIVESDSYNSSELMQFMRNAVRNGDKDIYSVISSYKESIAKKLEEEKREKELKEAEQRVAFNETSALNFLGGVVTNLLSSMKMDEIKAQVAVALQDDVRKFIAENYGPIQRKIELQVGEQKVELKGVLHSKFETVLKFVKKNKPVFLTGPAGSGKNVICKQVAQALGLNFYFSNAVTQEYKLTGFTDANGTFHESQFYKAFKNGGVFMLDEMDASIPEVLNILNAAIANRYFDFPAPIGYVEANENFRVVAAGNTFGNGADSTYVGRNQLDGASLDRFSPVRIDYDSRIEEACANGDRDLLGFCRAFRAAANKAGINVIVSYRAIGTMADMSDCLETKELLESCLIKGLELDDLTILASSLEGFGKYSEGFKALLKERKGA